VKSKAPSAFILLLGNKSDRRGERKVESSSGQALAEKHKIIFYETSTKGRMNSIDQIIATLKIKVSYIMSARKFLIDSVSPPSSPPPSLPVSEGTDVHPRITDEVRSDRATTISVPKPEPIQMKEPNVISKESVDKLLENILSHSTQFPIVEKHPEPVPETSQVTILTLE
jgi:hypothetical protein